MSVAALPRSGGAPAALRRGQAVVIAVLLALAVVAWVVTGIRMAGMDAGPGTDPGTLGFYVSTWVVMMAAMMFPSIVPVVLTFRRMRLGAQHGRVETGLFVCGYLLLWGTSGLLFYAAVKGGRALDASRFGWHRAGRWVAVGVILVAAVYELMPLKGRCLSKCRNPAGFLLTRWRGGRLGALSMGIEHGAWCLGCCWALMAALFALGAMSLTWMLVVSALIAAEKLVPWRTAATVGVTAVLVLLAVGVAAVPRDVPGLTLPGGNAAMHAMGMSR